MLTVTLSRLMSLRVAIFTYFTKFPCIFINKHLHVFWTEKDRTSCYILPNSLFLSSPPHATHKRRKYHSVNCFSCSFIKTDKNQKNVLVTRTSYNNEQKFLILLKKKRLISHLMDFTSLNKPSHFKFPKSDSEQQQEKWLSVWKI